MVFVSSVGLLIAIEKVKKRIGFVSSDLLKFFVFLASSEAVEDFIWSLKNKGLGYLNWLENPARLGRFSFKAAQKLGLDLG